MDTVNMSMIKDNYPEDICPDCKIPVGAIDGT